MSQDLYDLRDYLFDELTPAERAEVESYLRTSADARTELERLRLTHKALLSLPEEEIPRRIAFVSDPVLEPSPWRRVWRELWAGAPRFAIGMAALLLVLFGGVRATEPTLTADADGWRLAFGAGVSPTQEGFSAEQVEALVNETVALSEARQLAAVEAVAASTDGLSREWLLGQIAAIRRELAEVHEDAVIGYEIVNTKHETLRKQLFETDFAAVSEVGR